jgi:hypothetical protein
MKKMIIKQSNDSQSSDNQSEDSIFDYMNEIYLKCHFNNANSSDNGDNADNINNTNNSKEKCKKTKIKKLNKIDNANIIIPTIHNYNILFEYNYNIQQLKEFVKYHKLKQSGNKNELLSRLHIYLKLSFHIIKIQKIYRGRIQRIYNSLHGPAYKNRSACTNANDFFTMDDLSSIPNNLFFSYKDVDNFVYGFDVISLYNLISKSTGDVKNPYNRIKIPDEVIAKLKLFLRLSKILDKQIDTLIKTPSFEVTYQKSIELKILDVFQYMDSLGNYSNPSWFMELDRLKLIRYMRELIDIWDYRAQITIDTKRAIYPPNGDPFVGFSFMQLCNNHDIYFMRKKIIEIIERIVTGGIDRDNKSLGCYYVLGALTIVNENAAGALPWLYQTFVY